MMKRGLKIFTAILIGTLLTSCGIFQSARSDSAPLRVGFSEWWGDYTLIVAEELGYFEKYGVDVELVYYDIYSDSWADLATGDIDGGLFLLGDTLNISRHIDLKVVAVYDDGGFSAVVATPEIASIQELRGQNVGVPLGSIEALFVIEMLSAGGLNLSDVSVVAIDPEDVPASLGNDITAGYTYEPFISESVNNGNQIIYSSDEASGLLSDVITFRSEVANNRSEDIRNFLKAWFEAVNYRNQNLDLSRQIIASYLGLSIDDIEPDTQVNLATLEDNESYFGIDGSGQRLAEITLSNGEFLIQIGTLSELPNFDEFLDPSFLK